MASILNLTSGIVYLKSVSGGLTITTGSLTLSGSGAGVNVPSNGSFGIGSSFFLLGGLTSGVMRISNIALTAGAVINVTTDGTLAIRNAANTAGTGNLDVGAKITAYNQITTAGAGVEAIVASARSTAQTAAVATVTSYSVPATDGSYEVVMNVLVTTATTHTFTCECAYTDEGNSARTVTIPFRLVGDTTALTSSIANGAGAVPYNGVPLRIRCKASTTITLRTQAAGTYTTVTYNVEGAISWKA